MIQQRRLLATPRFCYGRRLIALICLVVVAVAVAVPPAGAQPLDPGQSPPPVELIMDASGSMNGDDGTGRPKIDAAKEALATLVDSLPEAAPVGLRVYGHRVPNTDKANGCTDTELIVPVGPLDKASMRTRIDSFAATGFTPIGLSLQQAAADLPPEGPRSIILVSDGVDTCAPPDPCQVARDLAAQGIDLRIEAVGFQVDAEAADQLRCIAEATGGSYVDAPDAQRLTEGLARLSARALRTYVPLGAPVQGGSGPTCEGAPTITPGQYVDSMGDDEERWYAVELQRGQRLEASGTLILVGRNASSSSIDVEAFDSEGSKDDTVRDVLGGSKNILTGGVIGDPLGDDEGGREPGEGSDKGLHCLRLATTNLDEDVTFPLEILIQIEGPPPSLDGAVGAPGRRRRPGSNSAGCGPRESNEVAVLLVVGFVCLLVGALCAWLLSGRRAGAKVTLILLVMAAALGTGETSVTAQVAESVVGGGSFNTAPVLSPGSYGDAILAEEYLYYAFGQQATLVAEAVHDGGRASRSSSASSSTPFATACSATISTVSHRSNRTQPSSSKGPPSGQHPRAASPAPAATTSPWGSASQPSHRKGELSLSESP